MKPAAAMAPTAMAPGAAPAIRIYKVLTRTLATKGRLAALGFLGLGSVLLGLAVRLGHELDRAQVAYSAVFCGLGLRVRRALAWGLAYLLIWEQAVGRVSHGAARASLFINARSLVAYIADRPPPRNAVAPATAVILLLVVSVVAVLLTTRSLNRGEVT